MYRTVMIARKKETQNNKQRNTARNTVEVKKMARVSNKGKGRGGFGHITKRNKAYNAYVKRVNRQTDLTRKS